MVFSKGNRYIKVDNRTISSLNKNRRHKRALSIYLYSVYFTNGKLPIHMNISTILDIIGLKLNTSNKRSVLDSLQLLVDKDLIEVYNTIYMDEAVNLEELKGSNSNFWVKPTVSDVEIGYTLIPISSIERVFMSKVKEGVDDMILVLAYICRKIERRKNISPITWVGINTIEGELHIDGKRFSRISKALLDIEVIYFDIIKFDNGSKNYIYSLYEDRYNVSVAINIAKHNGVIDKRIKLSPSTEESDSVVELDEHGEYAVDMKLSQFFDVHKIACNDGVMAESNKYSSKHGLDNMIKVLNNNSYQVLSADNKIGAYRSILRKNY